MNSSWIITRILNELSMNCQWILNEFSMNSQWILKWILNGFNVRIISDLLILRIDIPVLGINFVNSLSSVHFWLFSWEPFHTQEIFLLFTHDQTFLIFGHLRAHVQLLWFIFVWARNDRNLYYVRLPDFKSFVIKLIKISFLPSCSSN